MKYKSINIGIITRNRALQLEKCLISLTKQTVLPSKVIIVDNDSKDQTKIIALRFSKQLNIQYFLEKQIGIPFARNRVLRENTSSLVAFIDDDCEASNQWLKNILESHNKHPRAAAIQGLTKSVPKEGIFAQLYDFNYRYWIYRNTIRGQELLVCDTNNFSINREIISKLNIKFDESISRGSDVDFAKQITFRKQTIIFNPNAVVSHQMRADLFKFLYQHFQHGQSQAIVATKWPHSLTNSTIKDKFHYQKLKQEMFQNVSPFQSIILAFVIKLYNWIFQFGFDKGLQSAVERGIVSMNSSTKRVTKVTVAIVTRNRSKLLYECLRRLNKQTVFPEEILIVDNGSSDTTKEVADYFKRFLPIRYLYEEKIGTTYARNRALEEGKSEILAFTDDDCEVSDTWVEEIEKAHKKNPQATAILGKSLTLPEKGILTAILQKDYDQWILKHLQDTGKILVLDTANTSMKLKRIRDSGVKFDTLFIRYCDDVDFAHQILYQGGNLKYVPSIIVSSRRRENIFEFYKERFRKGFARALLDYKWSYSLSPEGMTLNGKNFSFKKSPKLKKYLTQMKARNLSDYFDISLLKQNKKVSKFELSFSMILLSANYFIYKMGNYYGTRYAPFNIKKTYQIVSEKSNKWQKVSVMLITKNRFDTLTRTLKSLNSQTVAPHEILIVDSSDHPIEKKLKKFKRLPIKYIYTQKLGFGVARNLAVKKSTGDIITTIDDDAEAPSDWISNIISAHNYFKDSLVVQGSIWSMPADSPYALVEQCRIEKWLLGSIEGDYIKTISTKNVSFKLKRFKKLKLLFNETQLFGKYGGEDIDIAKKINIKREKIIYSEIISINHWERNSLISYLKQQYRKGSSNGLIGFYWNKGASKNIRYITFYKIFDPIFDLVCHPRTRDKKVQFLYFLAIYYLSGFFFNLGKKNIYQILNDIHLGMDQSEIPKSKADIEVVVEVRNNNSQIFQFLKSIFTQTTIPAKLTLLEFVENRYLNRIIENYDNHISIKRIKKISTLNNPYIYVIKQSKNKLITFINEKSNFDIYLIQNIISGHKKYNHSMALQGQIVNLPKNGIISSLQQFNRQSIIRSLMGKNRYRYQAWINGDLKEDFKLDFIDFSNISFKTSILQKKLLSALSNKKEPLINNNISFFKNLIKDIRMVPTIKIFLKDNISLSVFFKNSINDGIESRSKGWRFNANPLVRIAAFGKYCIANKNYIQLPLMIILFCLYLWCFYKGKYRIQRL